MPSFITFDGIMSTFIIKPRNPATDLGMFTVNGEVSDGALITEFSFKVDVYNTQPTMKEKL